MHKQHEEQPFNSLPDLSTWHLVPVGATIPKGTPYAYVYNGGLRVELGGYSRDITVGRGSGSYYTEQPVPPPLPTEEGATIVASGDERPPYILLTRKDGRWITRYGREVRLDQIRAWAPVTVGETVVMP